MKALSFKRLMPIFAFFIMLAGARAADYLWEPKLMWESKTYNQSVWPYFYNNDENIIFSTGKQLVVLDSKTGEEVKKSKEYDFDLGPYLQFSSNENILYGFCGNPDRKYNAIFLLNMKTMEYIDTIQYPFYDYYLKNENGETVILSQTRSVTPVSENKILLQFEARRVTDLGLVYGRCFIAIDPTKPISWDKPEEIKIEYYIDNYDGDPVISSDHKYLFHTNIVWDLVKMKEYWQIPNGVFANITNDAKHIYVYRNDSSCIYNLQTKELIYKADSKLIYGPPFTTGIKFKTNDPSRLFYSKSGDPFFDFKDNQVKYSFNPETGKGVGFYNNSITMFINRGNNNIIAYSINPISSVDTPENNTESLQYDANKLLIPNNDNRIKEIVIYNADGKLINKYSKFDNDENYSYLDISSLSLGVYFVTVINFDGTKVNYKFIKGE